MEKTLIYGGCTFEGFTINEKGEIRNLKTGNILKPTIHKASGYIVVYLPMGARGKVKAIRLHKAVAEAFIPNPDKLPIVNHIDEDKTNYSIDNLEWVTAKQNSRKHIEIAEKENWFCNKRKLSREAVVYIRQTAGSIGCNALAKMFNVSHVTIQYVRNGTTYCHVE